MIDNGSRYILIKGIRQGFFRWVTRKKVLTAAEYAVPAMKLDGSPKLRLGKQCYKRTYTCAICLQEGFKVAQVSVDHRDPVGWSVGSKNAPSFWGWDDLIGRMFCDESNLQVLCKTCHDSKSIDDKASMRDGSFEARMRKEKGLENKAKVIETPTDK